MSIPRTVLVTLPIYSHAKDNPCTGFRAIHPIKQVIRFRKTASAPIYFGSGEKKPFQPAKSCFFTAVSGHAHFSTGDARTDSTIFELFCAPTA